MSGRATPTLHRAGLTLTVVGGLTLIGHPGLTAPGVKAPRGARPAPVVPGKPAPAPLPAQPVRPNPVLPAVPPAGNEIMSVKDVRPGMKGYGLTVFRGTKLERFDVEIVGVMPKAYMGQPLVLVRLSGGPITGKGAYLIQGMSGSPIYVNGKLLGAFSMGDAWPKEPLGMVTPVEDMMEALDPKLSEIPAGATAEDYRIPGPNQGNASTGFDLFSNPAGAPGGMAPGMEVAAAGRSFKPLALPVSISGLSSRNLDRVAGVLKPFNMSVMQGPGSMAEPIQAEMTPGAAIGVALMTGDVDMTAIGTVTYRSGDKLLAFGHPMMQIGAAQFPISTAWIHDVFPGYQVSHKIGSGGQLIGTLTQDRPFSIAAKLGPLPQMVPIRVNVKDQATGRTRAYNMQAANHPLLVGQLLPIAVNQSLFNVRPVPGDTVAKVKLTVETEGAGTVQRENIYFDPFAIDIAAIRELQELMGLLANNSFRRVPVKNLVVDVSFEEKRPTATVERIFLNQDTYAPGEEVSVGVVLRPYRKDPVVVKTKLKVPETAANGRALLMVQGGSTRVNIMPPVGGGAMAGLLPPAPPPDASLRQVLKRFTDREKNNELVTRVLFPTTAVNVEGERLSQLPSPLAEVMRSSKTTGLRLERDEEKASEGTEYVIQGVQTLEIKIERPDHLEKAKPGANRSGGSSLSGPMTSSSSSRSTLSSGLEDLEEFSRVRFIVDGQERMVRLSRPMFLTPEEEEVEAEQPEKGDKKAEKSEKPEAEKKQPAKKTDAKAKADDKGKKDAEPASETPATSATPAASTGADEKLIGRQAKVWTQTTQADFERGTLVNTAISTEGDVRLAPGLSVLHESAEQYVWTVAGLKGAVYAGTGNGGKVVRLDAEGKPTVVCRTGELQVHSLARDKAGNLYAGTSPNGKIFRITPDGKGTELFAMNGAEVASDKGSKYVLSMAVAEDGTVYAGTGPEGKILRVRPGANTAEQLANLPVKSVMSLLLGADGSLYAGTTEDGVVYRIDAGTGAHTVVYDTDQPAVTALAMDGARNLYVACAPSGEVIRVEPDGTPRPHFDKAKTTLFGLLADNAGNLYAAGGDSLFRIEPDGSATVLKEKKAGQFTALAWADDGRMVAGTSNVGSVYRLSPTISGSFESTVHDAKLPARWGRMRYTGLLPDGGVMKVETRSGNTPEPDASWSGWSAPAEKEGGQFVTSPAARFLQYRVLFQSEKGTPALRDMTIHYMPRNQAPKLTLAVPVGGEIWKGSQTLKWSAVDPDSDTLTYELFYSGDGGKTWTSVGEKVQNSVPTGKPGQPASHPDRGTADEALERYKKELDGDASLTPQQRQERLEKAKTLVDAFLKENPADPKSPSAPAATAPKQNGVTRQATFNWDTRQVPDGVYVLRVVATDKASNPSEPLSDVKLSEPFIVSNTPPQLFVFEKGVEVDAEKNASVVGFSAGRVSLKGAQYRVDGGDWVAIEPEDGIWDSAFEHFRFKINQPGSGEHTVEVRIADAAGNQQVAKAKFKVP